MITPSTLKFLSGLKANNSRRWFDKHRKEYEAAKAEFIEFTDLVIAKIAKFDPPIIEQMPEDCLFRINRDTRFSKDKTPYKTHLGAFITDRGRKVDRAGYYVQVAPGDCFIAGGVYMPPSRELKAIRRAIDEDAAGLRKILRAKPFVKWFGAKLPGARLKTAPRDYPKDHPDLDLLQLKSFEVYRDFPDRQAVTKLFAARAAEGFKAMHDYVHWLNRALDRWGG